MLNNVLKKKTADVSSAGSVRCCCGAEIPFVPSVKYMSEAIEAHVSQHEKEIVDQKTSQAEADRIRQYLTEKVAEKASSSSTKITKIIYHS